MASQSDKTATVFSGESDCHVSRLMKPVHGGMTLDEHKAGIVVLEALGRLDRELRKAGVQSNNVMIRVIADTQVDV